MGKFSLQKENLYKEIRKFQSDSIKMTIMTSFSSLISYFHSLLVFGRKSTVTKDNLNIIKELFYISRTEKKLLDYILRNIENIDIPSASEVINSLDRLRDETLDYYKTLQNDIKISYNTQNENLAKNRRKQEFYTLTQTSSYANSIIALTENKESIKEFLEYEEEFWQFIEGKVIEHRYKPSTENMFYSCAIYDENNIIDDIKMLVPKVVDLNSALLYIKLLEKAYKIYKSIGKEYIIPKKEQDSKEESYRLVYLPMKTSEKRILKKQ